ncbi:LytR/AlgR family response regulator transcription factor [Flavobacterium humidisoli]|uniref:LytTR family DNA-binding domain-containing protein n=1 Tax=Flavobacterium humidisoli TaxID=2937442 RepID=A0ABY4LXP9_9FLAO|nr:LytTR family DNA-binding domain-containing protein [Flavobacterium humidisoli]UPZ17844.1 LytTR family DNA-binding domain-containing protein [Flavobacterium humidisoli]
MMSRKVNALLVDDDLKNLELLKHFLIKFCPLVNIIGEANNVKDAIALIENLNPELIYTDIQLDDKNAFDVLDQIKVSGIEVIFVTAYSEYALKALKYNALDYILKPLAIEDIIVATNKAVFKLNEKKRINKLVSRNDEKMLANIGSDDNDAVNGSSYLAISSLNNILIIKKDDILYCKSEGRYTIFFLKNKIEHVSSKNLGEYELILNKKFFLRIHHSYIVNIDHILCINKKQGYYCEMVDGSLLPISRRKKENLLVLLKI